MNNFKYCQLTGVSILLQSHIQYLLGEPVNDKPYYNQE